MNKSDFEDRVSDVLISKVTRLPDHGPSTHSKCEPLGCWEKFQEICPPTMLVITLTGESKALEFAARHLPVNPVDEYTYTEISTCEHGVATLHAMTQINEIGQDQFIAYLDEILDLAAEHDCEVYDVGFFCISETHTAEHHLAGRGGMELRAIHQILTAPDSSHPMLNAEGFSRDDAALPSPEELDSIVPGDLVRVVFYNPLQGQVKSESMWVRVEKVRLGTITGFLDNSPLIMPTIRAGDEVVLSRRHVLQIKKSNGNWHLMQAKD